MIYKVITCVVCIVTRKQNINFTHSLVSTVFKYFSQVKVTRKVESNYMNEEQKEK